MMGDPRNVIVYLPRMEIHTAGGPCRVHYRYKDTTQECWSPLNCRQCLDTKGCKVSGFGLCQDLSSHVSSDPEIPYTTAIAQNLALPAARNDARMNTTQIWTFEASKTAYCPDDDAVCSKCIAEKFWTPFDNPYMYDTRFCVGANGCVCISACYIPSRINKTLCQPKYPTSETIAPWPTVVPEAFSPSEATVPPTQTTVPPTQTTAPPSPSRSTSPSVSSSSGSGDSQMLPSITDDECRYSGSAGSCRTYRSCHDCTKTKGCRISEYGYCEVDAGSDFTSARFHDYDYTYAIDHNLTLPGLYERNASELADRQLWRFPASEVFYCSSNDQTCNRCIWAKFWMKDGETPDSRFCVSENGCVCVANCVRAEDASTCPQTRVAENPPAKHHDLDWPYVWIIISAITAVAMIISTVYKCRSRLSTAPARSMDRIQEREPSAPPAPPGVRDAYRFFEDQARAYGHETPTAPTTPARASAPTLDLQRLYPHASMPQPSTGPNPRRQPTQRPTAPLELYGWISHRQHLIDNETRRLNGADDFVPTRNRWM